MLKFNLEKRTNESHIEKKNSSSSSSLSSRMNGLRLINFPWICTHNFFIFSIFFTIFLHLQNSRKKLFLAHKFFFISNLPTNLTAWDFFFLHFFHSKKASHTHTKRENFPQFFLHEKETRTSEKNEKKSTEFFYIFYFLWWFEKEKWLRRALEWQQEKVKERKKYFSIFLFHIKIIFSCVCVSFKNFLKTEKIIFWKGWKVLIMLEIYPFFVIKFWGLR